MKKIIIGLGAILAIVTIFAFTSKSSTSTNNRAPDTSKVRIDWTDGYRLNYSQQPYEYFEIKYQGDDDWIELDCFLDGEYEWWEDKKYYDADWLIYVKVYPKSGPSFNIGPFECSELNPQPWQTGEDWFVYQFNVDYDQIVPPPDPK
ncbi:hypothetical protein ACFLSY_03805 [Bacteroidota bacterium]